MENQEIEKQENQEIREIQEERKSKRGRIIRIAILIAALAAAVGSIFLIRGCSAPPKYEEVKDRFEQLVNDSHKVNKVLFGEGLPTYERVYNPQLNVKVKNTGEFYTDDSGIKQEEKVSYYRAIDGDSLIYAFRFSNFDKYAYAYVSDKKMSAEELKAKFPAIEGVSAPKGMLKLYGKTGERQTWYYRTFDKENIVYAFRAANVETYSYVYVSDVRMSAEELEALFPAIEGVSAPAGKTFYSEIYTSANGKRFSYLIPYVEAGYEFYSEIYASDDGKKVAYLVPYAEEEAEFYYPSTVPSNYDVVRNDCGYTSVEDISTLVKSVYSRNYYLSLQSVMFDGVASTDSVLEARYSQISVDGRYALGQLNTYEPLFSEQRVYMFDTAKVIKWGSNSSYVRISVQTYLPSAPDKIVEVEIDLALQDGEWYLDSPTF